MALARLNRPSIFVYGGTILPGCLNDRLVDIVSIFEAIGAHASAKITSEQLEQVESCAIPGPGSCGGMYTANTMASAIEALGMSFLIVRPRPPYPKRSWRIAERPGQQSSS